MHQGSQSAPLLFRLALHRGSLKILELEPVGRPPGTVVRAEPLRDNPLQQACRKTTSPVGMLQVLIEPQA
jgi:hypothetical protein